MLALETSTSVSQGCFQTEAVNYRNTGGRWSGFARSDHFAVRWTGRMRFFRRGTYHFSIYSDDGSKLWFDNRYTINNDGLHGWRNRVARRGVNAGWHLVRLEMFERGGHAGMLFRYHGPDTSNRWIVVRARNAILKTWRTGLPLTHRQILLPPIWRDASDVF